MSHDVVVVRAKRRYIIKCCDLLSWMFGLTRGSDSHQNGARKQTPDLVFPSQHILIKALLFVLYTVIKYKKPVCGITLRKHIALACVSWVTGKEIRG